MAYNLLGMLQPQQNQMQTLLGEYYDPRQARMAWLGGALQAAGAGLASGRPGAWAEGLALGGSQGMDNYRQRALAQYAVKQRQDDRTDEKARWQQSFDFQKSQAEAAAKRQAEADARAAELFQRQKTEWAQEDALQQGKKAAVTGWLDQQNQQGANILPQNVRTIARQGGVESTMSPTDEWRYNQLQPAVNAGDYETAYAGLNAVPETKAPSVQTFYEDGMEVKKQWDGSKWVSVGGPKAPSGGITVGPDGSVQIGGPAGKLTEGDKRARLLGDQVATQEPIILETFDALSDPQNLAGTTVPGGRYIMTGNGKAAYDAISNIVGNWLYLVSGATATDDEVRKRTNEILPAYGDDARTISLKKARLQSYINGMKNSAGIKESDAPAADGTVVDGFTIRKVTK